MSRHSKIVILLTILIACLFIPWTTYGKELTIDILDIGQGDSILIQTPEKHRILIDGGPDESVIDQLDEVMPFWDRSIDVVIPTHPQADHITGLASVIQRFHIGQYADTPAKSTIDSYKEIMKDIEQENIPEINYTRGSIIKLDSNITIDSLWPPQDADWNKVADLNDVAQVCLLKYGNFSALFTGDAGANIDRQLEALGDDMPVDVLKVGHHGSKTGTDQQYLAKIHPLISVISVGAHNTYGHPAPSTLKQLQQVGSSIWRTDLAGRIEIHVDRSGISVYSAKIKYNTDL